VAEADAGRAVQLDEEYAARLVPRRDPEGHKGTFGTVLCICGSLDYVGAGILSATAAARGGAGLVALAVPRWLQPVVAGRVPEIVTIGLPASDDQSDLDFSGSIEALRKRPANAIVFGPGVPDTEGYRSVVLSLIRDAGPPMVVDGTGLTLLSGIEEWWSEVGRQCVLTPHPGEFERLTGSPVGAADAERLERCQAAARKFNQVVVLKGARTVIASPDGQTAVSPFANPALATAGSGDVLAGLIGALLAQGSRPFDAACLGVFLHGMAGERVSRRVGDSGLLASDLPYEIALARHELAARRGA
jgi:ADP-dependent NAD(P)H-hydrate dehydratase / NAD(P)H-hydrate epimerase